MDIDAYIGFFDNKQLVRFAYLRAARLREALADDNVVDRLVKYFEVPGKPALLKSLTRAQKLEAIATQVDHSRRTKTSIWHDAPAPEVLVASIYESSTLSDRYVLNLFSAVKDEAALLRPVAAWLKAQAMAAYDEVFLGNKRVDVLGSKKGGLLTGAEFVGVELKDDLKQLQRGLDQMSTYCDYCHRVYLACTPQLAIEFLLNHADGRKVTHWDSKVLDRKLEKIGVGLLLVEGTEVYEVRKPKLRSPAARKLEEVELAMKARGPL